MPAYKSRNVSAPAMGKKMVDTRSRRSVFGVSRAAPEAVELKWLLDTGIHLIGADEGSLLAYDEAKRVLRFVMTAGNRRSEQKLIGQTVPLSRGLTGLAAQLQEVQIGTPTYHKIEQVGRHGSTPLEPRNVIAAPMVARGVLLGVMTAVRFSPHPVFTMEEGKLLGRFAAVAGLVIEQHRRLEALAAERKGHPVTVDGTGDRHQRKILAAIAEVRRHRPQAMAGLARTIGDVAALIVADTRDADAIQ